jgi:hypothetical protein
MFHKPVKAAHVEEAPRGAGSQFRVADIIAGQKDAAGVVVETIYVKRPPRYAVYRTQERVVVHYADHDPLATAQAAMLAKLSPLRGAINGLVDGWRTSRVKGRFARARSFDRQVGDALIVALEGDQACAEELLNEIKTNIRNIRVSWARFLYLIYASVSAILLCGLAVAGYSQGWATEQFAGLWLAGGAGAVGAFFSIAVAIRNRTVLPDLRWLDNLADAVLRIVIGVIAAVMLTLLLRAGVVKSDLLAESGKLGTANLELALVVAFVAGFLERLVPDLLEKSTLVSPAQAAAAAAAAQAHPAQRTPAAAALATAEAEALVDTDEDTCVCDHSHAAEDATSDHDLPVAVGGVEALKPAA